MNRAEAIEHLLKLEPELRNLGVRSLSLFGSVLRGDNSAASDLDLLVEFDPPHTWHRYFDVLFLIEDNLGIHVDLAEPETLHPRIRDRVIHEALKVA